MAGLLNGRIAEEMIQRCRDLFDGKGSWAETETDAELFQAVSIVWLIVCHGHDELWNACSNPLRKGADTAMMHKGRGLGEECGTYSTGRMVFGRLGGS